MGLNFCSSTAIELMGTYHTTNLSMLLPLLITTALLAVIRRLPQAARQVTRSVKHAFRVQCLVVEPIEDQRAVVGFADTPRTQTRQFRPVLETRPPQTRRFSQILQRGLHGGNVALGHLGTGIISVPVHLLLEVGPEVFWIAGEPASWGGRLAPGAQPQLVEMSGGQGPVPAADGRQEQFSQFPRVGFGRIVLGQKMAQGFAHDLAGVGVSAGSNFMSDEALEVFCQCHLHGRIFPREPPDVNRDHKHCGPRLAKSAAARL